MSEKSGTQLGKAATVLGWIQNSRLTHPHRPKFNQRFRLFRGDFSAACSSGARTTHNNTKLAYSDYTPIHVADHFCIFFVCYINFNTEILLEELCLESIRHPNVVIWLVGRTCACYWEVRDSLLVLLCGLGLSFTVKVELII